MDRPTLPDEIITPGGPAEQLARQLYWEMERLEPTDDDCNWDCLSEHEKNFYRSCISGLFDRADLIRALLDRHLLEL